MRKKRRDVVGAGGSVLRLRGGRYLEKVNTRVYGESGCGLVMESWDCSAAGEGTRQTWSWPLWNLQFRS